MAYSMYSVQMSQGWRERVEKENAIADKFWNTHNPRNASHGRCQDPHEPCRQSPLHCSPLPTHICHSPRPALAFLLTLTPMHPTLRSGVAESLMGIPTMDDDVLSSASTGTGTRASSSRTTDTKWLKTRLLSLEKQLEEEKKHRVQVQDELAILQKSTRGSSMSMQ